MKKIDIEADRPLRRFQATRNDGLMTDAFLTSDPAYPIVVAILEVVPASRWAFARVTPNGNLFNLLRSDASRDELPGLQVEFKRQRSVVKTGPRIAAEMGRLEEFESGITLIFADARATFGILTLLRSTALGSFTSSEISMLTFALAAVSEQLSALQLKAPDFLAPVEHADEKVCVAPVESPNAAFYLLDHDMGIALAWNSGDQRRIALTGLRTRIAHRLLPFSSKASAI